MIGKTCTKCRKEPQLATRTIGKRCDAARSTRKRRVLKDLPSKIPIDGDPDFELVVEDTGWEDHGASSIDYAPGGSGACKPGCTMNCGANPVRCCNCKRPLGCHKAKNPVTCGDCRADAALLAAQVETPVEDRAPTIIAPKYPKIVRPAGVKQICFISDVHVPEHNKLCWSAWEQWAEDNQPDEIIINGDFVELESTSQHGSYNKNKFVDDVAAGRKMLQRIRSICPNAVLTYLQGNHEFRLERFIEARVPSMGGALTLAEAMDFDRLGIRWVPTEKQPIDRGAFTILHGDQCFSDRNGGPLYPAAKLTTRYMRAGSIVVAGHVHRMQWIETRNMYGNIVGVILPCMRTIDPDWLREGRAAGWVNGFGVGYVRAGGTADLYIAKFQNNAFMWPDGRLYVGRREAA